MASTTFNDSWDQIIDVENVNSEEYKESVKSLRDALLRKDGLTVMDLCEKSPGLLKEKNPITNSVPFLHEYLFIGKDWEEAVLRTLRSNEFPKNTLNMKNSSGGTALTVAVRTGNISIVECLLEMNWELLSTPNNAGLMPVVTAIIGYNLDDMADYLYEKTPQDVWSREDGKFGATLIIKCIKVRKFDIAIKLLKNHWNLMLAKDADGITPIHTAACAPNLFCITYHHKFLPEWISNRLGPLLPPKLILNHSMNMKVSGIELLVYMGKAIRDSEEDSMKTSLVNDAILEAIKQGNFYVFYIGFQSAAFMLSSDDDSNNTYKNMLMCAIEHRQSKVFSHLYCSFSSIDDETKRWTGVWQDERNNNILHIAGKLAPRTALDRIPGPALQIQRELQWFKEVEKLGQDSLTSSENIDHVTPRELFTENHKDLVLAGEKWMKDTALSCTIIAPLIITIMFPAAFQLPGGNDQEKGFPIFLNKFLLKLYVTSVAVSFFSATTSLLVFLKILTSNYTEEYFLKPLPNKLIIGLSTLFLSLVTMIVAFCSGLFLTLRGELEILIPIITLAAIPIGYFGWTQFPLLVEIWRSTYRVAIFDRKIVSRLNPLAQLIWKIHPEA